MECLAKSNSLTPERQAEEDSMEHAPEHRTDLTALDSLELELRLIGLRVQF